MVLSVVYPSALSLLFVLLLFDYLTDLVLCSFCHYHTSSSSLSSRLSYFHLNLIPFHLHFFPLSLLWVSRTSRMGPNCAWGGGGELISSFTLESPKPLPWYHPLLSLSLSNY